MNEIAYTPYLLIVPANSKFQTLKDIVAAIQKDPTNFRVPSLGGAGTQDFFTRQFLRVIGVDYKNVSLVMGKSGNDIMLFTAQGSVDIGPTGATRPSLPRCENGAADRDCGERTGKDSTRCPTCLLSRARRTRKINAVYWVGLSGPPRCPRNRGHLERDVRKTRAGGQGVPGGPR